MKFRGFLALLLIFLCGCGHFSGDIKTGDETARIAVLDKNQYGNAGAERELVISMRKPLTLNPLLNEDPTVDTALKLIFEPLFNISEEQSVISNIGESFTVSPDGTELTVRLKDGLKWHDGEAITAEDVVYSLDTIKRASDSSIYKGCIANVSGYESVDSLTAVIYYNSPYSMGSYNLCFPLIPKHYYRNEDEADFNPLGDGAYSISDSTTNEYSLVAASGINGTPKIASAKIIISPDRNTDYDAFEHGITSVFNTKDSRWLGRFSGSSCEKVVYSTNCFEYFGFNNQREMFKNQSVRQAIAYAIDREEIARDIYMDNMDASLTPVNPTAYMSNEDSVAAYDYSPDEALKTLWSAGLSPYNYSFSILVNEDNAERVETAEIIAEDLNRIGMKVSVVKKPFEEYQQLINADEFDAFIGGTDFRSGFDLRDFLLSSSVYSGTNYVNFSDEMMDTLLNAEIAAVGQDAQKAALKEVERYVSLQLPVIGIGFRYGVLLTSSDISGVTIPYINNCFAGVENWSFEK